MLPEHVSQCYPIALVLVSHCAPPDFLPVPTPSPTTGIVGKGEGLPCPVDASGRFTSEVSDFAGRFVKDADKDIIAHIKAAGHLVDHANYVHSYPFCWRSDQPLIYKVRAVG